MPKRSHTQLQSAIDTVHQPPHRSRSSTLRASSDTVDDIGEFEDAWEDEIEDDHVPENPTKDPEGPSIQLSDFPERLIVISKLQSRYGSR